MNEKKLIIVLTLVFLMCAGLVAFLVMRPPAPMDGRTISPSAIGGPFSMVNDRGEAVTDATYEGRYKMMFFGFTHCPSICPGEMQKYASVLDILAEEGGDDMIAPLFITIDPARDDVAVMHEYVNLFDPRIIGLTGSQEQVAAMKQTYRIYAARAEMPEADDGMGKSMHSGHHMTPQNYMMDHSTFTYLMSPDNQLLLVFDLSDTPESIAAEILPLLQ